MAGGGDQHLGLDDIGVHTHLSVVVQGNQGPVGYGTTHVTSTHGVFAHNEILAGCGVEELHIGGLKRRRL